MLWFKSEVSLQDHGSSYTQLAIFCNRREYFSYIIFTECQYLPLMNAVTTPSAPSVTAAKVGTKEDLPLTSVLVQTPEGVEEVVLITPEKVIRKVSRFVIV